MKTMHDRMWHIQYGLQRYLVLPDNVNELQKGVETVLVGHFSTCHITPAIVTL